MARTVRNAKIDTRSARAKLTARREPYWTVVRAGCAVGYRKGATGGTWIARYRDAAGKQHYQSIGTADDGTDPNGVTVLSYGQAQERARTWFAELDRPAIEEAEQEAGPYTVADAIRDYLKEYEARGGKAVADARMRADALIIPKLGEVEVSALTTKQIREWHQAVATAPARLRTRPGQTQKHREHDPADEEQVRRRRSTANRMLTILKAALNAAFNDDQNARVTSDLAWRRVKPFREADAARVRYLQLDECARLIDASEPGFGDLVEAAVHTGCRYGELGRMLVEDFNADVGTLLVRRSKGQKARHVVLTDEGREFFARITKGRSGSERLFVKSDGKPWAKSHQMRPIEEASRKAGIVPSANFHALRHTYASHAIMNGVPLDVVARNLGHVGTRMVERHYGHLAPSYVADAIRAGAPTLRTGKKPDVTRQSPE